MKKLSLLLIFAFTIVICNAQAPLEKNQKGEFREKSKLSEQWNESDIVAEPEALKYVDKFPEAISNPGAKILVNKEERNIKLKLVFKKLVEVREGFIVYNSSTKKISYVESKKRREESSYLILFGIVSLILMIISNILSYKDEEAFAIIYVTFAAAFATFVFAFVAFVASFAFAAFAAFAFAAFAALAAVFAAIALITSVTSVSFAAFVASNYKTHKMWSIVYYAYIVISFILLFM